MFERKFTGNDCDDTDHVWEINILWSGSHHVIFHNYERFCQVVNFLLQPGSTPLGIRLGVVSSSLTQYKDEEISLYFCEYENQKQYSLTPTCPIKRAILGVDKKKGRVRS